MGLEVNNPAARLTLAVAESNVAAATAHATTRGRAAECEQVLDAVDRRERGRRRALQLTRSALVVTACTAVLQWVLPAANWSTEDRHDEVGQYLAAERPSSLRVGDGSVNLARGARVRRWFDDRFVLEAGSVEVRFRDSSLEHWTWNAGAYAITGAPADVDLSWDPGSNVLQVRVRRGAVRVEDPARRVFHLLSAGDSLRLTPPAG